MSPWHLNETIQLLLHANHCNSDKCTHSAAALTLHSDALTKTISSIDLLIYAHLNELCCNTLNAPHTATIYFPFPLLNTGEFIIITPFPSILIKWKTTPLTCVDTLAILELLTINHHCLLCYVCKFHHRLFTTYTHMCQLSARQHSMLHSAQPVI